MNPVYQEHFGFKREPFNITPDPTFLYPSSGHREALAQLSYGIRARKGFVVLTGEIGTGKTTLIHTLLNELNTNDTHTALIFGLVLGPHDLLRYVCEEFQLAEPCDDRKDFHYYVAILNQFLLEKYRKGDNCALILDEAQNLSTEVLETIRILSNFETSQDKLLQILLVGQPELAARLNSPDLRQLKQRVALRHHLRPLTLPECSEYVANRLELAGGSRSVFTQTALETIYAYSGGTPRLVNILCDNAMITAYALEAKTIHASVIQEVAEDLCLLRLSGPSDSSQPQPLPKSVPMRIVNKVAENASPRPTKPTSLARPSLKQDSRSITAKIQDTVAPKVFERMLIALTDAMGPMAPVVMHDRISFLGESFTEFPKARLKELLELLSEEILSERLRVRFERQIREAMLDLNRF